MIETEELYYDLCPFTTHSESKQTMVHYSVKHIVSPLCGPSSDELQLPQAIWSWKLPKELKIMFVGTETVM